MELSRRQEAAFISLYQTYGRSWDWSRYASAISDAMQLRGGDRITGPEMRRFVEYNRKRLQDLGLRFPQLPKRIDKRRFAELYRAHGEGWTWPQYAKELSAQQGFTGKDEFTATSISAYVSRHRAELTARPRRIDPSDYLPWPALNWEAYKQTHYWRFLILYIRAQKYGEESLRENPQQYARYQGAKNKLWRNHEVIRYDPDRGFYPDAAHADELDPPQVVELEHYYYARHPEHRHRRKAKDT